MLQDLTYGTLQNEFRSPAPQAEDRVLCFRGGELLIFRDDAGRILYPDYIQAKNWILHWNSWNPEAFRYVFRMQDVNYFLFLGESGDCPDENYRYEPVRRLRDEAACFDPIFAAFTGLHLYRWYRSNRFCGACGTPTVHDDKERMLRCPKCGNLIFPRINPAVIVAVTHGDKLLLTKYAGRSFTRYALVAGFTEIGETLEQTVAREVMEEVGLKVQNIRYYKSQPWGVDGNILAGFYCDLDGDDTIHLDETELSVGEWHPRDNLPAKDDRFSLTREMIRVFEEGREPQ